MPKISIYEKWKIDNELDDKLLLIECWARDGLTDEQIFHNLDISKDTFYQYKKKYTDFSDALKRGKEVVDYEVENALLKRAMGYEYVETTRETKWNPSTEQFELVESKKVTKHVIPDTTAQIYWLKNRKPKQWRDKVDVDNTDVDNINNGIINIANLINNPHKARSESDFNE